MVIGRARASEEGEVTPGPQVIVAQATEMAVQQIRDQMQQGAMQPLQYTPIPADADPLTRREMEDARPTDLNVLMGFVAREEREGFNARLSSSGIQNNPDELWETFTARYQECRTAVEGGEVTQGDAVEQTEADVTAMNQAAIGNAVGVLDQQQPEGIRPLLPELIAFAAQGEEGDMTAFAGALPQMEQNQIDQLFSMCRRVFYVQLSLIKGGQSNDLIRNNRAEEGYALAVEADEDLVTAAETFETPEERGEFLDQERSDLYEILRNGLTPDQERGLIRHLSEARAFTDAMLMNREMQLNIEEAAEQQGTETPDIDIESLTDPSGSAIRTAAQERARDALDKLRKMQQQGMSETEIRDSEYFTYLASVAGSAAGAQRALERMSGSTEGAVADSVITQAMMRRLLRAGYMDLTPHKTSEDRAA